MALCSCPTLRTVCVSLSTPVLRRHPMPTAPSAPPPPCRHLADKLKGKEGREATLRVLDQQVQQVNERRAEEAAQRRAEIAGLQALWQGMAAEQEAQEAANLEKMKALAAELQEFNRIKRMQISEAERRERWVRKGAGATGRRRGEV